MSVIDRVKTHFETLQTITIEVPEWKDDQGNPSLFYSEPLTLEEKNIIFKKSESLSDVSILADIVVMKSLDKDGKKIFKLDDKMDLMTKVDSDVLSRVATAMVKVISPEEVKKN